MQVKRHCQMICLLLLQNLKHNIQKPIHCIGMKPLIVCQLRHSIKCPVQNTVSVNQYQLFHSALLILVHLKSSRPWNPLFCIYPASAVRFHYSQNFTLKFPPDATSEAEGSAPSKHPLHKGSPLHNRSPAAACLPAPSARPAPCSPPEPR